MFLVGNHIESIVSGLGCKIHPQTDQAYKKYFKGVLSHLLLYCAIPLVWSTMCLLRSHWDPSTKLDTSLVLSHLTI